MSDIEYYVIKSDVIRVLTVYQIEGNEDLNDMQANTQDALPYCRENLPFTQSDLKFCENQTFR